MMNDFRQAWTVELHEPRVVLVTGKDGALFVNQGWSDETGGSGVVLVGRYVAQLLESLGIPTKPVSVPGPGKSLLSSVKTQEFPLEIGYGQFEYHWIKARIDGPQMLSLLLRSHLLDDPYVLEVTYCGAFTVVWASNQYPDMDPGE